jgi:hypothetical protein
MAQGMFRISSEQLNKVQSVIAAKDALIEKMRLKERATKGLSQAKTVGEIVGTALVMGAVRGKCEKEYGNFQVPGLEFDAELALGVLITGAGFVMAQTSNRDAQRYSQDVLTVGSTILAGFARGVARNWGKTGEFSLNTIAGGASPRSLPGWVGYAPTPAVNVLDALSQTL